MIDAGLISSPTDSMKSMDGPQDPFLHYGSLETTLMGQRIGLLIQAD